MSRVRWGISLPQHFPRGRVDMQAVRTFARQAEAAGYDSLWVQEGVVSHFPVLEPVSLLCYCSALTSRVRLGSSVILLPLRNPSQLAGMLATVDCMSGGRLIVGVGLGNPRYYPAFGVNEARRGKRLEEYVRLIKTLWTQSSVSFQGEFCCVKDLTLEPKPDQKPHPPVWFGASHPAALRRAVRFGEGWMGAGSSTIQAFEEAVSQVRALLQEEGRDGSTFSISKRIYVAIDDDRSRAEAQIREFFGNIYGKPDRGPQVSLYGSADECAEGLARILSQDPDLILLTPVRDHLRQMELLSERVLPQLE